MGVKNIILLLLVLGVLIAGSLLFLVSYDCEKSSYKEGKPVIYIVEEPKPIVYVVGDGYDSISWIEESGSQRHELNSIRAIREDEEEQVSEWELAIKKTEIKPKERIIRTGLLFTAGLIAGEALTGVIVAFIIISGLNIQIFKFPPVIPGLLLWLFIALLVFYIPLREIYAKNK